MMTSRPHRRAARVPQDSTPSGRVRIIGGQYRRTPIAVADVPGLRPTPDRVRGTLFNWLEHRLGSLAGRRGLDLFAGTGALGFEMASRGAREVVLVDSSARAVEALRALAQRLGAPVTVLQGDWRSACARPGMAGSFDVVFLDPPFDSGLLVPALAQAAPLLAPGGLVYAEAPVALDAQILQGSGFEGVRAGHAGMVYYHLLRALPC